MAAAPRIADLDLEVIRIATGVGVISEEVVITPIAGGLVRSLPRRDEVADGQLLLLITERLLRRRPIAILDDPDAARWLTKSAKLVYSFGFTIFIFTRDLGYGHFVAGP